MEEGADQGVSVKRSKQQKSKEANAKAGPMEVRAILDVNLATRVHRLCIGTPMTGLLRAEWVFARFGQTIPTNWSHVDIAQFMSSYIPLSYQVADAQNLICREVVQKDFTWMLLLEHDNLLPPETFVKLNQYMIDATVPVVSALYFTKSVPPEPMIYRENGNGHFANWKLGDKVWARYVPTGTLLIHASIIKAMWDASPEYMVNNQTTRRIFETPSKSWIDPNTGASFGHSGTSDIAWCERVVREKFLERAGWASYQKKKWPFLVDTGIFVKHIDQAGAQYPLEVPRRFLR